MTYNIVMTPCDNFCLEGEEEYPAPFVGDVLLEIAEREGVDLAAEYFCSESQMWKHLTDLGIKITGVN